MLSIFTDNLCSVVTLNSVDTGQGQLLMKVREQRLHWWR